MPALPFKHVRAISACVVLLSAQAYTSAEAPVDFAHEVLPILRERCAKCHSAGKIEGDLSMESRRLLVAAEAITPGDAAGSLLVEKITASDPDERMPPEGDPLTPEQINAIRRWIDDGAPWRDGELLRPNAYVAPLPPRHPKLPRPDMALANPIDRLLIPHYAEYETVMPEPLGDAAFMRRVSLDLVGLLPEPDALEAFVNDAAPDKRARLIDALLADNRGYAEHWLTFWNDLLRNDYAGTGFIDGGRKQISEWLYNALLENKPYDQFVRELITATQGAEGFNHGIVWRGRINASQVPELQFAQNVGQVFLGVNLKCASCHDSFVNSWKLADAYGLAAVVADRELELHRCDKPTGVMAEAAFLFPELGTIDASLPRDERLAKLADLLTEEQNGRFARTIVNRLWDRMMGHGIIHPVDAMDEKPFDQDLLDFLATDLVDHGYDIKHTLRLIATSNAYQSKSVPIQEKTTNDAFIHRGPIAKRMTAEQFVDATGQILGVAAGEKPAFETGDRDGAVVRASLVVSDPLMRSLGRPNREQVITARPEELTTLVALDLTNGPELTERITNGAERILENFPNRSTEDTIEWLYLAALSRYPTPEELSLLTDIAGEPMTREGLADVLWSVFMLPEFQFAR